MAKQKIRREKKTHHKLGSKRGEEAVKHRKDVQNFSQSRDVHEDRSVIQRRLGKRK